MIQQLELTDYVPPARSRRGEPVAAFVIEGAPQVWKRAKPFIQGGFIKQWFDAGYAAWRDVARRDITTWWRSRGNLAPLRVALIVRVVAVVERPDKPPTYGIDKQPVPYPWAWTSGRLPSLSRGDVDNYGKAVLDVMQLADAETGFGPMLADDRFVVRLEVEKVYAAVGEEPRTEVRMWRAS